MNPSTVWAAWFSATGTTEKVVCKIAGRLAEQFGVPLKTFDFTLPEARKEPKTFGPGDLVVLGTPVYAGRIPNLLLPYVSSITGPGAVGVPVSCYGNRNYDDALMELRNTMAANGFAVVAGAAFSCEHSFSDIQGGGRPDVSDLTIASGFADSVFHKLQALDTVEGLAPVYVKGNDPVGPYYQPRDRQGNPISILKAKPLTSEACTKCGKCARECPLGSIDREDPTRMVGKCMKCNRCVKGCPVKAKYFDDAGYLYHREELEAQFTLPRKEPELFL